MEEPTIGIKIADGSYFPVLEEGNTKRKRLILTTVNDDQESVQIDLYKGEGSQLHNAVYVGSLLIENIEQGPKESSEIELKIGFDKDGNLNAEAVDLASGQIESLSVSLASLGESSMYDIPEFSLDDDDLAIPELDEVNINNLDLDDLDFGDISEGESAEELEAFSDEDIDVDSFMADSLDEYLEEEPLISETETETETEIDGEVEDDFIPGFLPGSEVNQPGKKKSSNPVLLAVLVLIAIAVIAGISYLVFRSLQGQDAPVLEAKSRIEEVAPGEASELPVVEVSEAVNEDAAPVVGSTGEEQQLDEATTVQNPVAQESVSGLDTTGVWYKIRWGDTLWGISSSFYNSPKGYNQIVKENSIKDPNIIFAETEIFIPSE